jgi:Uma2 family endonuclease
MTATLHFIAGYDFDLKGTLFERMTDDEFMDFCTQNTHLRIERKANGEIIIGMPNYSKTGAIGSEVNRQLANWNWSTKRGIAFDASAGFRLKSGAMRAGDAHWISHESWNVLTSEEQGKFAQICPDFVIEIKSETDTLEVLQEKMTEDWISNGCKLAWLIDPETETSYIYYIDGNVEMVKGFDKKLSGEKILEGFELNLSELKSN